MSEGGEVAGEGSLAGGALTVAEVHEAIAAARPDEECLVFRDRRLTWADVTDRTRRLANVLHEHGLGCRRERGELERWESGQDHLAIYLHNGNEYLEAMLGAFKARVAPFNVNYRYVAEELRYLLVDAGAAAIVFHSAFAPVLAGVFEQVPALRLMLQVADDSGNDLLPGATWYEDALAAAPATPPPVIPSPDDLYILYTGGTTGMPKGVLWRQGDALTECFGASPAATSVGALVADAGATAAVAELRALIAPPFMHGAGHWIAFRTWLSGGTVIVQSDPVHLDPVDIWSLAERERVTFLLIVGDAFARPLLDELGRGTYDLSSLTVILSGGAPLAPHLKAELLAHLPTVMIVDGLGSSEAGGQLSQVSVGGGAAHGAPPRPSGTFLAGVGSHVLDSSLTSLVTPGTAELGWLAKRGRLALGYLGDAEKTNRTYPVVDGVRYAVPGDRARLRADGTIELHGRDSVTINSGGEKIFAEEVEAAIKAHPAVYDCVVAARPSARWGQEVVAIVHLRDGAADTSVADLAAEAARHIARYKVPKSFVFVDEITRSPAGKADYRWARDVAARATPST
jgi:fatty-acyl-CoA synthase